MLFNSFEFIFAFLPITFFIYFYLSHKKFTEAGKFFLVISNLFFYSWWNIVYLPLILFSIIFNYFIGKSLTNHTDNSGKYSKKSILAFGILANLALLGYFKYSDFFIENVNIALQWDINLLHLALPLAISFFTFQQIAYLVDSYSYKTEKYTLLNYALFVTFFPQLIAGPIVHHKEMMPQFANIKNKIINYKNISMGLFIFSIGLFKKVLIADTFAIWANAGYNATDALNLFEAWATSLSYGFQLYFDFSGYTDMAIGLALLFNIRLPINFNSPYKATNIQDFWRRWHITLSRFLKDYIYIPLGGNKKGHLRTYANVMMTFILGGIWHGAGWTFIFWGFLHGFALLIHKMWNALGLKLWPWAAWLITFNFVNITWVFFRAKDWDQAITILNAMFSMDYIVLPNFFSNRFVSLQQYTPEYGGFLATIKGGEDTVIWITIGFILILYFNNSIEKLERFTLDYKSALFTSAGILAAILSLNKVSEFLYFNF